MKLVDIVCRVLDCDYRKALYHIKEGDVYVDMIQRTDPDLVYYKYIALRIRNQRFWISTNQENPTHDYES